MTDDKHAELEGIIRWSDADGSGYEYAIQQGPHGDEFVQLYNRPCLRRKAALAPQPTLEAKCKVMPGWHLCADSCAKVGECLHAPSPALDPATVEALRELLDYHQGYSTGPLGLDRLAEICKTLRRALLASPIPSGEPFQSRVKPWMDACFGPEISADRTERNHRFLEEALELVQACGCTQSEAHQLVDYVYGRDQGDISQEVGGVMVTLAALCLANGFDMHAAAETELARIWTKVEQIRAKQAAKPKNSPLPAAPCASKPDSSTDPILTHSTDDEEMIERVENILRAKKTISYPSSAAAEYVREQLQELLMAYLKLRGTK